MAINGLVLPTALTRIWKSTRYRFVEDVGLCFIVGHRSEKKFGARPS